MIYSRPVSSSYNLSSYDRSGIIQYDHQRKGVVVIEAFPESVLAIDAYSRM